MALGGLLTASLGVFLAPLWHLGPVTALALWGKLVAAAAVRPVAATLDFGPALAEAASKAAASLPPSAPWWLLGAALLSAGALAFAGRRSPWAAAAAGRARG